MLSDPSCDPEDLVNPKTVLELEKHMLTATFKAGASHLSKMEDFFRAIEHLCPNKVDFEKNFTSIMQGRTDMAAMINRYYQVAGPSQD